MDPNAPHAWFEQRLLDRFLRYVTYETTSDPHSDARPSTPGQRVFAEELVKELGDLGCRTAGVDVNGYVQALLPGKRGASPVALIAHLDTSPEAPGKNVKPLVHRNYKGKPIRLKDGVVIDPRESPALLDHAGDTIITSSGDTLLGADDKAGVAAIVTAAEFLRGLPETERTPVEIVFTPDEEIGRGTDRFPFARLKSKAGITADGAGDGIVEGECFEAYEATVTVTGVSRHPGEARGRLVNAVEIMGEFIALVPRAESPQATDGRLGFYAPMEAAGGVEAAAVRYIIRDFDDAVCRRRIQALRALGASLEKLHPGAGIAVKAVKQYSNMKPFLDRARPDVLALLKEAVRRTGIEPVTKSIRGGTDGARLSEKGFPCPNLFDGGYDYHSRGEWASLAAMARSSLAIVRFAELWGRGKPRAS